MGLGKVKTHCDTREANEDGAFDTERGGCPNGGEYFRIVLVCIVILWAAIMVRIYGIAKEPVWFDEGLSAYELTPGISHSDFIVNTMAGDPSVDPFYFSCLWVWSKVFGCDIVVLRLFSVLLGSASLVFLYFITRQLFSNPLERAAAVALGVLSLANVYYSQEIRMYSMYLLLSSLSAWAMIGFFITPRKRFFLINIIANILLVWTHLMSAAFLLLQAIMMVWHCRRNYKAIFLWGMPQAINVAIWWGVWMRFMDFEKINIASRWRYALKWDLESLLMGWSRMLSGATWSVYAYGVWIGVISAVLVFFAVVAFLWRSCKSRKINSETAFILLLALLPIAFFFFSKMCVPLWQPRYTLYSQLGILLATVMGTRVFTRRVQPVILLAVVLLFAVQVTVAERPFRPRWDMVLRTVDDGRPVFVSPGYERQCVKILKREPQGVYFRGFAKRLEAVQDEYRVRGGWFVYSGYDPVPLDKYIRQIREQGLHIVHKIECNGSAYPLCILELH